MEIRNRTTKAVRAIALTAVVMIGSIGLIVVPTGCQTPGKVLSVETSNVCPTCKTETVTSPIKGMTYETHVCPSCRTVSRLEDSSPGFDNRDYTDRGRLRAVTPVMHVCDACEAVVGVCPQCRKENE